MILCDDDAGFCRALDRLAPTLGFEVLAEISSYYGISEAIDNIPVDVLVLGTGLRDVSVLAVLQQLGAAQPAARAIVITGSTGPDDRAFIGAGAAAVIERADIVELEAVLTRFAAAGGASVPAERRQTPVPDRSLDVAGQVGPWGLDTWETLSAALAHLAPSDSILALDVVGVAPSSVPSFLVAHRLELARLVGTSLRAHDRIGLDDEGRPIVLLVATTAESPIAVFDRAVERWSESGLSGTVIGSFTTVRDRTPMATLDHTLDLLDDRNGSAVLRVG